MAGRAPTPLILAGSRKKPDDAAITEALALAELFAAKKQEIATALFDHFEPYDEAHADGKLSAQEIFEPSEFQNMLLWTIYFWLMALLVGVSAIGRVYLFFTRQIVTAYDLIESLTSLIAVVGLFGFAYQTPIAAPTFWKVVWVLLMLTWVWSFFGAKNVEMIEKTGLAKGATIFSLISMLAVPALVGLCIYGFRSEALWNK